LVDESNMIDCWRVLCEDVYSGRLSGREGLGVWISCHAAVMLITELSCKSDATDCRSLEKTLMQMLSTCSQHPCSVARLQEILPHIIDAMASDDLVFASASSMSIAM